MRSVYIDGHKIEIRRTGDDKDKLYYDGTEVIPGLVQSIGTYTFEVAESGTPVRYDVRTRHGHAVVTVCKNGRTVYTAN